MARTLRSGDILLDGKPYTLARRKDGARVWQVQTAGSSTARLGTEESRYGNQQSTVEMPLVWADTHRGYGDERQIAEGRYHYSLDVDARFPEQVILGPLVTTIATGLSSNITRFAEINGSLLFLAGRYVKRIGLDGSLYSEVDLGSGNTGLDMETWNGNLYVGLGFSSGDYIYKRTAAGNWSQSTDVQLGYMAIVKDQFWASGSSYQVQCVTGAVEPLNAANWSGLFDVGDPGTSITGLCALGDTLYIGKTDGLHALDASGIAPILSPELRGYQHTDNCRHLRGWHGAVVVPHIRGLFGYRNLGSSGFQVFDMQPGRDSLAGNPVRGMVTALAGDDRWLYAAVYDGTNSYIVAGRQAAGDVEEEFGALIWHPLAMIANKKVQAMHISGLWTNPRLFIGAGPDVAYIILPRYGDNPLMDTNCRFATSGSIYYPADDMGASATPKLWKSVEIEAEGLTRQDYADVYYRADNSSWIYVGRAVVSPRQVFALDAPGVSAFQMEMRLDIVSSVSTSTPKIRRVILRGAERPQQIEVITAQILCSDQQGDREGIGDRRTAAQKLSDLKELSSVGRAVVLKDLLGLERRVIVHPPVDEQEIECEGSLAPEVVATVRMAVFHTSPTVITTPEPRPGVWGSFAWGDGTTWS